MTTSLVIQATYEHVEIGLFTDGQQKEIIREDKRFASKTTITHIETLLKNNSINLANISFIAVNQGPAPFTSLRVVISTVNGLSFASTIPLIGIDGLSTFIQEHHNSQWPSTIALFNAFNNDVYFAIETLGKKLQTGYENIEIFSDTLQQQLPNETLRFIGNGADLFRDTIIATFGNNAYFPEPLPQHSSLDYINKLARKQWHSGHGTDQVLPLYLKSLRYKPSIKGIHHVL